jgi:hypothetical protein
MTASEYRFGCGLFLLISYLITFLIMLVLIDEFGKKPAPVNTETCAYMCDDIAFIPLVGITTFIYCKSTDMVWNPIDEKWQVPTDMQQQKIDRWMHRN